MFIVTCKVRVRSFFCCRQGSDLLGHHSLTFGFLIHRLVAGRNLEGHCEAMGKPDPAFLSELELVRSLILNCLSVSCVEPVELILIFSSLYSCLETLPSDKNSSLKFHSVTNILLV